MLTVLLTLDATQARRRFDLLTDSYQDLNPVLAELSKFKQAKIADLFASGGAGRWPEASGRTQQRQWKGALASAKSAPEALRGKLDLELRRARKRLEQLVERGVVTRTDRRGRIKDVRKGAVNAVARRAFVAAEFERHMQAGSEIGAAPTTTPEQAKAAKGLGARLQRAVGRAQKRPLGHLAQTIRATIQGGILTIDSDWNSPAPLALNDGATVGHGAKVEPRPFLYWDESDAEYFRLLLLERGLLAWSR